MIDEISLLAEITIKIWTKNSKLEFLLFQSIKGTPEVWTILLNNLIMKMFILNEMTLISVR